MSEVKSSSAYTSAVTGANTFIVHTPIWVTVVRGFQLFFGFIILILAGLLIHGLALDAIVFGLVCVSSGHSAAVLPCTCCQSLTGTLGPLHVHRSRLRSHHRESGQLPACVQHLGHLVA